MFSLISLFLPLSTFSISLSPLLHLIHFCLCALSSMCVCVCALNGFSCTFKSLKYFILSFLPYKYPVLYFDKQFL